ncbi:universal stress protein [Rhodopirellula maiorica SM1]|uniref:Universal stress protein n=1 Tax=Rhodopirellula maiorica SM1 TaxID=1265738 RepID=M5RM92_9BACT|nr:universal stress protein [Rhodopirellula maiorica]EMI16512.1 universal stress protein [Rhodopirellula maiorica SM1]
MRVLAAVDRSAYASYALDCLKRMPCHDEVDLSLVTVSPRVPEYDLSGTMFAMDAASVMQREIEAIRESLNAMAAFARNEFRSIETLSPIGPPGHEIVRLAREKRIDLVLMGATGHSALARVLLGSVSDYVATHADCSTLVVRPMGNQTPDPKMASPAPSRVLIAISNAESDVDLAAWIARLGLSTSTEIHLVYVEQILHFYDQELFHQASKYRQDLRPIAVETIETIKTDLQSRGFIAQAKTLESSHIGHGIVEYAEQQKCDLIITGDQRETLIQRLFLGSNSRHVLRHAPCSVLISRTSVLASTAAGDQADKVASG